MTAPDIRRRAGAYDHDDARLAALEQRVYGLERGVQDLNQLFTGRIGDVSAQLSGLASKLDDRSRTPWGTIVSAMGVVLAIVIAGGQLAKTPLDDAIDRLERDTQALGVQTTPLTAFAEFKATYENNRLVSRQDYDARLARADAGLKALEQQVREGESRVVPRGEHVERWRSQEQQALALQRQIDDLKQALGSIYGARDVIIDLRERLDRIERARSPGAG